MLPCDRQDNIILHMGSLGILFSSHKDIRHTIRKYQTVQVIFHIQDSFGVYHIQDATIFRTLPYSGQYHIQDDIDFNEGKSTDALFSIDLHVLVVKYQEND